MTGGVLVISAADTRDAARAAHRALRRWRTPTAIARPQGGPLRLEPQPVRWERADALDLDRADRSALATASSLVVISGARAAESPWVDEMLRTFAARHPGAPIIALGSGPAPGVLDELDGVLAADVADVAARRLGVSSDAMRAALHRRDRVRRTAAAIGFVSILAAAGAATAMLGSG